MRAQEEREISGNGRYVVTVLDDFSMEMTGKDVARLEAAAGVIPLGTRIHITFLDNEDLAMRVNAAAAAKRLGFTPVPHISARRITSQAELEEFLSALRAIDATEFVFAVGGDPAVPLGPYEDSLALIESGLLQQYGVKHVSIGGYPDGHPDIPADVLWSALESKSAALAKLQTARCGADPGRVRRGAGAELGGGGPPARRGAPGPGRGARARPASRGCSGSPPGSASPPPTRSRRSTASP